jgi:hypothetical protein
MSALGSLANALLDASRVADLNMHVGSYLLSGFDVRFGSIPALVTVRDFCALPACYAELNGWVRPKAAVDSYLYRIGEVAHHAPKVIT